MDENLECKLYLMFYERNHMKLWLWIFSLCVATQSLATTFKSDIYFTSKDGTQIAANLFYHPNDKTLRPAIIFVNSWVLEEHEYYLVAKKFAEDGYNVMSYSARGWGASQGEVNVASPEDIQDMSAAVDYMINQTHTDPEKIGASGVSYGGGISFLASAKEPRIKAIAALSGWVNLVDSLLPGKTANQLWSHILLYTGQLTGRLSNRVKSYVDQLNRYENLEEIRDWAKERSADQFINDTNRNQTAVLIVNSWNDSLFNPNSIIEYFKNLKTPKKLVLQEGIHGISEVVPLVGIPLSNSWDHVKGWFDEHLKGQPAKTSALIEMKIRGTQGVEIIETALQTHQTVIDSLHLHPSKKQNGKNGGLDAKPPSGFDVSKLSTGKDSDAGTGIPILGALFDAYLNFGVAFFWPRLSPVNSFSFKTEPMRQEYKLRGASNLNIHVTSTSPHQTLLAYLYDIDRFGISRLITHAVVTYSGQPDTIQKLNIQFFATAYNIPKGHRLGLVMDSHDDIYKERHIGDQQVNLIFSETHTNTLNIRQSF